MENDYVKVGTKMLTFGNYVTAGKVADEEKAVTFGSANNRQITADEEDLKNLQESRSGSNLTTLSKGNFIHELGHNLGGVHGDPGSIMLNFYADKLQAVDDRGVRAIIGRMDTPRTSVASKYITAEEEKRLEEKDRAGKISHIIKE